MSESVFYHVTFKWPPSQNESLMPGRGNRRLIKTQKSRNWFADAKKAAAEAHGVGSVFPHQDVFAYITLYPASNRPDVDNCIKKIFDAMSGEAYHDDRQIVEFHVKRGILVPDAPFVSVYVWEHCQFPDVLRHLLPPIPWGI